jgi:aspartokinase/homoserine dehydrogenase 1
VFGSLGRHHINVSAIAQGASERNISFVIDSRDDVRALKVIHEAFFEKHKRLSLVVIGVGNIGAALLAQLRDQRDYLLSRGFDIRVIGLANSKQFALDVDGIDLARWRDALGQASRRMSPGALIDAVRQLNLADCAVVDCTADQTIADAYIDFVNADLHIVTPNKRANVLPWTRYSRLLEVLAARRKHFLCEANVGAGLPVISTVQDLLASGDVITRVEGILSGTLSYLFNAYDGSRPFSGLVRDAHAAGFTEPDPREDLSGRDVARKLLILARQMGLKKNIEDIPVVNLVPPRLRGGKFSAAFFDALARSDAGMRRRWQRAASRGTLLRYVGTIENGRAHAGLREVPRDHPFAATKGSDNVIAFTTRRYADTPLVVQGPGAGADVTAMGVFSDILKLLHYLPH